MSLSVSHDTDMYTTWWHDATRLMPCSVSLSSWYTYVAFNFWQHLYIVTELITFDQSFIWLLSSISEDWHIMANSLHFHQSSAAFVLSFHNHAACSDFFILKMHILHFSFHSSALPLLSPLRTCPAFLCGLLPRRLCFCLCMLAG